MLIIKKTAKHQYMLQLFRGIATKNKHGDYLRPKRQSLFFSNSNGKWKYSADFLYLQTELIVKHHGSALLLLGLDSDALLLFQTESRTFD